MSISKLPVGNFQGEKPTDSYMPPVSNNIKLQGGVESYMPPVSNNIKLKGGEGS